MPSRRGFAVAGAAVAMWLAARLVGSPGLEVIAVGLLVLPVASALFVRWGRTRIAIHRRLAEVRVQPGTRVTVELDVENHGPVPSALLLVQDALPPSLGRPARLVVSGVPGDGVRRVSYTALPQTRGRYRLGPLTADIADPFALARVSLRFEETAELLVTPEIEDLFGPAASEGGASFGASRARRLFRSGSEYSTMRRYQEGDDLRRIHWPSVARTGELMIRQDESSRRASGLVFLDTREQALGRVGAPGFERAVSAGATLGVALARRGFSLRLATADTPPAALTEDGFLDALAAVSGVGVRSMGGALANLRAGASADTTLVFVSAPPATGELTSLIRSGAGFGPKLAILIHPAELASLPREERRQREARAAEAVLMLTRAGWDPIVLTPSMKLRDRWHAPREQAFARNG